MTDEHKRALAQGRREVAAVRAYLDALRSHHPRRGRKRTTASVLKRLDAIDLALATADPLSELRLVQEKMDLHAELDAMSSAVDPNALEAEFVKVAKSYGERQGIRYAAWRRVGVQPAVLKAAGVRRGTS
jgi:hypothetical protein